VPKLQRVRNHFVRLPWENLDSSSAQHQRSHPAAQQGRQPARIVTSLGAMITWSLKAMIVVPRYMEGFNANGGLGMIRNTIGQ
jgi:hypothetical protein